MKWLYCILLLSVYVNVASALEITHVAHSPNYFEPEKGQSAKIEFNITQASNITVNIYDDRNLLIKELKAENLSPGRHALTWAGRDQAGSYVPAEAYHYTISAVNPDHTTEHDFSDFTGNEQYAIDDINWNDTSASFEYSIKKPSRVFIRVGIAGDGPLMATILNWVVRKDGRQHVHWDGMDASGVLNLAQHPKLLIDAKAYTLPLNTIIVGPEENKPHLLDKYPWGKQSRKIKKAQRKQIYAPYQQPPDSRGDYLVNLKLPDNQAITKTGLPILSGTVPVRLNVDERYREIALNRRSEPVFYIDGQFAFENEVGFLPMTWHLDTSVLHEGEHYLTVNLRGYEGNFGIATTKIFVDNN